jgi:hypothetical protein
LLPPLDPPVALIPKPSLSGKPATTGITTKEPTACDYRFPECFWKDVDSTCTMIHICALENQPGTMRLRQPVFPTGLPPDQKA